MKENILKRISYFLLKFSTIPDARFPKRKFFELIINVKTIIITTATRIKNFFLSENNSICPLESKQSKTLLIILPEFFRSKIFFFSDFFWNLKSHKDTRPIIFYCLLLLSNAFFPIYDKEALMMYSCMGLYIYIESSFMLKFPFYLYIKFT